MQKNLSKIVVLIQSYANSHFDNLYRLQTHLCMITRVGEQAWIGQLGTIGCPAVGHNLSRAIVSTEADCDWQLDG